MTQYPWQSIGDFNGLNLMLLDAAYFFDTNCCSWRGEPGEPGLVMTHKPNKVNQKAVRNDPFSALNPNRRFVRRTRK